MSGETTPKSVTIFDVAREAGVSYSTVSRVVNNFPHVNPQTRARVQTAMEKLGYVANLQARSLAGGRSGMVGLLVYDLENSYMTELVRGVDAEVSAQDYDLMLATTHQRRQKESAYVARLTRGLVDGLLIVLPRSLDAYLKDLQTLHVPYVLIDYAASTPQHHAVTATNLQGMQAGVEYLIRLGHRRIGFVTGRLETDSARMRLTGYEQALHLHSIGVDPALIGEGDFLEGSGYTCTQRFLEMTSPPTAIVASSDTSAFGVIRAITERGLRVPEDISVMGFDDLPEAGYMYPPLTTIRQPIREMGRVATRLLVEAITTPNLSPRQVVLPTELIVRSSTAPAPVGGSSR
jgi:LacI family transcriptional regulator